MIRKNNWSRSAERKSSRLTGKIARSNFRGLLVVMTVLAVAVGFQAQVEAKSKKSKKTPVRTFRNPDGSSADGHATGSAELKRRKEGIRVEAMTTELEPGHAYSNWWIIFNNPEYCAGGAGACTGTDLSNPDVEGSVLYATGRVADVDGTAMFRAFLPVGLIRLNRTVEGRERQRRGPGLQDAKKAEVHYVIRSHGLASAMTTELMEQIGTFGGLCDVRVCFDPQSIVFPLK